MLFRLAGGGGGGAAGMMGSLVRHFSRKCAPDIRRIHPKVPREEAKVISQGLYQVIKERGPLSIGNTWDQVKDAGIAGLNSKTHMKILLKWMRGRKMLKLFCTQHGSAKKFLHCTLPEENRPAPKPAPEPQSEKNVKPSTRQAKKELKKLMKKQKR